MSPLSQHLIYDQVTFKMLSNIDFKQVKYADVPDSKLYIIVFFKDIVHVLVTGSLS